MKTPTAPRTPSIGFGFDKIMRDADHTRFPDWYARSSLLAPGDQPAGKPRRA